MKKVLGLFLCACIIMVCAMPLALALEAKPGDTVTVTVTVTEDSKDVKVAIFQLDFDTSVFDCEYKKIPIINMNGVKANDSAGVELKVKNNAPDGTYNISITPENSQIKYKVSNNTFTVKSNPSPAPHTHTWGEWKVTKPAAPGVDGEETRVCKDDPSHIETRKIDALPVDHPSTPSGEDPTIPSGEDPTTPSGEGPVTPPSVDDPACTHPSTSWKETKAASCTEPGETQRTCDACGEVLESKDIPALGHDDGEWVVVEKPTQTKNGLKQLQCTRCHEVLKEEVIDRMTTEWRYNQSVCSLGIRFRDIKPELTKKWFMFTPIDLSKDGIQTIDLIAANITYAGKVTLQVQDGKVTVNYKVNWPMEKKDMAFTLLPDLASVSNVDMNSMKTYSFGEEISIADDLNGDTNVLLYMLGHVNYDFQDVRNELFVPHSAKYQKLVTELKDLMD